MPAATPTDHPARTAVLLPALAVQTCHAPGGGVHEPEVWTPLLAGLHRTPDGAAAPTRTLLADPSLAGLPAALAAWGRDRLAVGAWMAFPHPQARDPAAILVAPTREAYGRLCRLLSLQAETPEELTAWLGDGLGGILPAQGPDLSGLIALVRDDDLGQALEDVGAAVHWRCQDRPDGPPTSHHWPRLWLPLVSLLDPAERRREPTRLALARRIRRRGGREALALPGPGLALGDLPRVAQRFQELPDLVLAGHDLLAGCGEGVPTQELHLPPSDYADADAELAQRAHRGAERRYGAPLPGAVQARLAHELDVIRRKGFSGYVLTVDDLAAGRRTCGRGSAASSLVVYCLGITNVDPLRYHLLFERFLSESRTDPPDIDVDFPWDERDAVFVAALARYGVGHVAMVATHLRLRPKGALRAVARAWGMGNPEITAIAQRLRAERRYGTPAHLPAPWPDLVDDAAAMEGLHIADGLHCGGLVITPEPIRDLVPVHPAAKEIDRAAEPGDEPAWEPVPAIAWEKDGAEAMGLVKIDILGNRSLAVIRDCLADLAALGQPMDEATWDPEHDPTTQALVAAGDTLGCFYIESPAMRTLQAKAGSGEMDRLVVHSSIIRPAANRWINEYLFRLHHVRRTGQHQDHWYPHESLRGLLSDTFGILSYQEDVMLVAQAVAGFDERGANQLRKALGHWDTQERLLRHGKAFRAGAAARGVRADVAETIWTMITSFSGYSFAKAHSASYAKVSFQCAWLKAHVPGIFLARVIANEGGFYQPSAYLEEGRRRGIRILGPSVLASHWTTAPEGLDAIRIGLHLVPLVSRAVAERILAERRHGPFTGIGDLVRRTALPERTLLTLARCGALDDVRPDLHRHQILWLAQTIGLDAIHRRQKSRGQESPGCQWIFPPPAWVDPDVPALAPPDPAQAAWERYEALGICPEHHPVAFASRPDAFRGRDLREAVRGQFVSLTVVVVTRKQVAAQSRTGRKAMAFVTLEDDTALIETVWFPEAYRRYGALLDRGRPLRVAGIVDVDYGVATLQVQAAEEVLGPWG